MANYISRSENETKEIAAQIAKESLARGIRIFALNGELGAGKTIFVQGFAQSIGIKEKIISPTFVLIRQHQIPQSKNSLYHIDLYRLENIYDLGLKEILNDDNNIVLIEWAKKLEKLLPADVLWINIEKKSEKKRIISTSPA